MGRTKAELWSWGKTGIKLGVAATLAAAVSEFLGLEYPFYAAIAPIIVMGQTRGTTLQAGFNRIRGTVVGTLVGAVYASGLGSHVWVLLLSVPSGVFLCNALGLADANRLAGYVTAIVILNHTDSPWAYAGGRFLETSIGIIAAILVDEFLWPAQAAENLRKTIHSMLLDLGALYQLVFECYVTGEYRSKAIADLRQQVIDSYRRAEKLWQEAIAEQHRRLWVDETWEFLLQRTWEHIRTMDSATESRRAGDTFWQGMQPELKQLAEVTVTSFNTLANAVATGRSHPPLPDLDPALTAATQQLDQLQSHSEAVYSPAELRRFFSFFYSMEEIAKKLKRMSRGL